MRWIACAHPPPYPAQAFWFWIPIFPHFGCPPWDGRKVYGEGYPPAFGMAACIGFPLAFSLVLVALPGMEGKFLWRVTPHAFGMTACNGFPSFPGFGGFRLGFPVFLGFPVAPRTQ